MRARFSRVGGGGHPRPSVLPPSRPRSNNIFRDSLRTVTVTLGDDEDGLPTSILAAVEASLPDVPRKPRDDAAVAALRLYAVMLDDAVDRMKDAAEEDESRDFGRMVTAVSKIGPRLEKMLDMLGMAPGSRPTLPPGGQDGAGGDPRSEALAALREDATSRIDPASFVDPAVTEADAGD